MTTWAYVKMRPPCNDEVMFDIEVDPVLAIVAGHREVVAIACGDPHNVPAVVVGLASYQ